MSIETIYAERCSTPSDIFDHLEFLHDLVVDRDARTVVELGVRSGNSTAALLAAVSLTDGYLWSIDVDEPNVPPDFADTGRWTFIQGDDLAVAYQFGVMRIDVLFIDSSHFYDHTLAELRLYGPQSDVIVLHDTELEHPHGAPHRPAFPVRSAIDTWCAETGRTWTNRPGCYGLGVIHELEEV